MAAIGERTHWSPSMCSTIVGTSAGALNAARVHSAPAAVPGSVGEALERLAGDCKPGAPSVLDRLLAPPRILAGRAVGRLAPPGKHNQDYEVASAPFHPAVHVVSCRRSYGQRRVARLVDAASPSQELYASAAIPGFAPPVELDGHAHVDGAVWSTTNADLVDPKEHDLLIVVAPMVPATSGSFVQRAHRASLLSEVSAWRRAQLPVVYVVPSAAALAERSDHEAFGNDARVQILS